MKHSQTLICLIPLLLNNCWSFPLETESYDWKEDPELTGDYFQGDIILDLNRNGAISEAKRWSDNTVLYKMSPDIGKLKSKIP